MGKDKCPECPKCLPGWLVQFGDLMSLLLCFFILLLSMATMDKKKVEEYFEVMKRSMGFLEGAEDTAAAEKEKLAAENMDASEAGNEGDAGAGNDNGEYIEALEEIAQAYNEATDSQETEEMVVVTKNNNEYTMDIPASLMFDDGNYAINSEQAIKFLTKIARVVRTMEDTMDIEVVGHSSIEETIQGGGIPRDSWDLSALRSISIIKELVKNKIEPARLKVSAHGSYRPKSDVGMENRRVELRFVTSDIKKSDIKESNFFDRVEN
ncbi:MAG: flagellar motor protein MotB [Arcobacteraceae bacterium]|nr:flagellar motor protein MotB [Arcobacteraceae bacterium]